MAMTPEWLSAMTALLAVTIGPFASIFVAKRQTRMSTVTESRVEWIKQLRDLVAQLLTEHRFSDIELVVGAKTIDQDKYFERLKRLFLLERQIGLMLNSEEPTHKELMRAVSNAVSYVGSMEEDRQKTIQEHIDIVFKQAQAILKEEWEVVKAGQ